MAAYIARRILLMIPTLFGIMLVTFVVTQFVPGGPVERCWLKLRGTPPQGFPPAKVKSGQLPRATCTRVPRALMRSGLKSCGLYMVLISRLQNDS